MAIQIPTLGRVQAAQSAPTGRINVNVQDQSSQILGRTEAINSVAQEGADLYQKFEDDKINSLSAEAEKEFTNWNNSKLQQLKQYQGDPTDAYAQYDTEAREKYEEILNRRGDLSDRVKRHLSSNLAKVYDNENVKVLNQRGAQQNTYENNLYESQLALKRNNLGVNAGYVNKDDVGSFALFDENIKDIQTVVAKRGLKTGTVTQLPDDAKSFSFAYRDEDGKVIKVQMSDIAKRRVAQELSEGVAASVETLIASDRTEEAKIMLERYKGYIDPLKSAKLSNKFKTADRKSEAFNWIQKNSGKSQDDMIASIEAISDPELRSEVLKIKDTDDNRIESLKNRKAKANYELLANRVIEKMNSSQPYYGLADLENDPVFKQTWDNLSAKDKKTVTEMIKAPKTTTPQAEAKIQNLFFGNDPDFKVETISPVDFQQFLSGLSDTDRRRYVTRYEKLRDPSSGEQRATNKRAEQFLRDQLIVDGFIRKDDYGKITGKYEKRMIEARNNLLDYLDSQPGAMRDKDLKDFVRDYSRKAIKDGTFTPVTVPVNRPRGGSIQNLEKVEISPDEIRRYKIQYYKENGTFPRTEDSQFQQYLREKTR